MNNINTTFPFAGERQVSKIDSLLCGVLAGIPGEMWDNWHQHEECVVFNRIKAKIIKV